MSRRRNTRIDDRSATVSQGRIRKGKAWLARFLSQSVVGGAVTGDYGVESLERRTMLTSFPYDATTGLRQPDPYYFLDQAGAVAAISYSSDVAFEALAGLGVTGFGLNAKETLGDLIETTPFNLNPPPTGADLFSIYVTQSTANSYISIYTVTTNPTTGAIIPEPFEGSVGQFGVNDATGATDAGNGFQAGRLTAIPSGTGSILIGAVDTAVTPRAQAIPYGALPTGGLGLYPYGGPNFNVPAGITVIPINTATGELNNFGTFLVGGTVTGDVSFGANLNEFYAGSILTGNVDGDFLDNNVAETVRPEANNFYVAGDLRKLLTAGPVGTDGTGTAAEPDYITNFDLNVGGKLGEFLIGNSELGGTADFAGTVEVGNSSLISTQTPYASPSVTNLVGYQFDQQETEVLPLESIDGKDAGWVNADLDLQNNTASDPEILGSIAEIDPNTGLPVRDIDGNIVYEAKVDGDLEDISNITAPDPVDYYATALMAGQTVQFSLTGDAQQVLVYDPDGRQIASNSRSGQGFQQFTADRPGLYVFEVGKADITPLDNLYTLTITGLGQMAIGGIVAQGFITDNGLDQGFQSGGGDIGVIAARDIFASTTVGPPRDVVSEQDTFLPYSAPASIVVASGNLRAVTATSIGTGVAGTINTNSNSSGNTGVVFSDPLYINVPDGSVGLIRATGTADTDVLALRTQFDPNYANATISSLAPEGQFKTDDAYASAIGGSIQDIDGAATVFTQIATNGGIGAIHAANMATTVASYIDVNADNLGYDGIIDLIDVPGQFGVLGAGGPQIITNQGGNVRYLDLGGLIFLPFQNDGEVDQPITYPAGTSQTLTDDSGTTYTVTANGPTSTATEITTTGTTETVVTGPQFTTMTYPVLDKAGEIPVSISSTGSLTVTAAGTHGSLSSLDIGSLSFTGVGRAIVTSSIQTSTGTTVTVVDGNGNSSISQPVPSNGATGVVVGAVSDSTDEFLSLTGTATINVLNITATVSVAGNSPVEIQNTTKGEVVNVNTPGIGTLLVDGNLGFGTGLAVPMPIMPSADIADGNTYPFVQQHTGVVIGTGFVASDGSPTSTGTTGDAVSIQVGGAAGNIEAGGTIQSLLVGTAPITGQFNGIVGPILGKRLLLISDGQGVLPTGTGAVGFSGIFATGKIGTITGSGDIRGNIVSSDDDSSGIGIDAITLVNASIIDARIATVFDFPGIDPAFVYTSDQDPFTFVVKSNGENFVPGASPYIYDIGPITVSGDGGIIGSSIETGSVSSVTVGHGGFGILSTVVQGQEYSRLGSVSASGYGIRNTTLVGFGYIGAVSATGNGSLTPVTSFGLDVRPSDVPNALDSYFGRLPDAALDLNAELGTSAATPNIAGVTDTGVIQDVQINGARDFTSLTAQKLRTAHPVTEVVTTPYSSFADIPVIGQTFSNSITFGGTVGSINVKQVTDGFQITAGKVMSLSLGNSVNRFGISVAGNLGSLVIHGNLGQYITDPATEELVPDSYINAGGSNGTITSLKIYGNLNANVSATGSIGSILVSGYVLGSITASAMTSGLALTSLRVMGGIRNGALSLKGNVGSIIVNGGLGTSTGTLEITGNAKLIEVGANKNVHANDLALGLTVDGTLSKLLVYGSITGSVHTLGDLTNLAVYGGGSTIISGNINVDGRLGTANINNGDISSAIVANGTIGNFTINRGSLLFGSTLESQIAGITNFKTTGGTNYGMFGSLLAASGLNDNIDISGNIGDGTDAAIITATTGNKFHVRGTIRNHSTITLPGALNVLQVDNGIEAGATITALEINKRKISGTNNGTIIVTNP